MESKRILGKIVSNKMWTSLKIRLIYVDIFLVMIKILLEKEIDRGRKLQHRFRMYFIQK